MSDSFIPRADSIEIFNKYDNFIFDADGVLWLDNCAIPGAIELLKKIKTANKRLIILTNNSTKSPYEFVIKCKKLGFEGRFVFYKYVFYIVLNKKFILNFVIF